MFTKIIIESWLINCKLTVNCQREEEMSESRISKLHVKSQEKKLDSVVNLQPKKLAENWVMKINENGQGQQESAH